MNDALSEEFETIECAMVLISAKPLHHVEKRCVHGCSLPGFS